MSVNFSLNSQDIAVIAEFLYNENRCYKFVGNLLLRVCNANGITFITGRLEAMRKKSLFETNRHLKGFAKYRTSLLTNVSSSTAIETDDSVQTVVGKLTASKGSMFHVSRPKRKESSQEFQKTALPSACSSDPNSS